MSNIMAGLKQSKKAVEAGNVVKSYVAKDADSAVVATFLKMCQRREIEVDRSCDMKELAKLCKIEVPTAVAVVTI